MRLIIFIFMCYTVISYSEPTNLYAKCKAEVDGVCQTFSIPELIKQKNTTLVNTQKDIFETTEDYKQRYAALESKLEQEIVEAIHQEVSAKGAGSITMEDYNADSMLMELKVAWNPKVKEVLKNQITFERLYLLIDSKVAKKIFKTERTHRFDMKVRYLKHQLHIDKMILKNETDELELLPKLTKNSWYDASKILCEANGGKYREFGCLASWQDAKSYCQAQGGRLPTLNELKSMVIGCGALWGKSNKNEANSDYQKCIKESSFSPQFYWSSTTVVGKKYGVWGVDFNDGNGDWFGKSRSYYVRCVVN